MNSISVWTHLQKEPFVCPRCGSTERTARDLCLRCMLSLGLGRSDDISDSETFDGLPSDIDLQMDKELAALSMESDTLARARDNPQNPLNQWDSLG